MSYLAILEVLAAGLTIIGGLVVLVHVERFWSRFTK